MKKKFKKVSPYILAIIIIKILVITYLLFQGGINSSSLSKQTNFSSLKTPSQPATINKQIVTITEKPAQLSYNTNASPTVIYPTSTPIPTNAPTPTISPCRMGSPTPVTPDPSVRIDSITPTTGREGDIIVIKGSGFGKSSFYFPDPTKFLGGVSLYGTLCGYNSGGLPQATNNGDYSSWTDTEIKVKVPPSGLISPGSFQLEVTSSDGKRSNRVNFQITE